MKGSQTVMCMGMGLGMSITEPILVWENIFISIISRINKTLKTMQVNIDDGFMTTQSSHDDYLFEFYKTKN